MTVDSENGSAQRYSAVTIYPLGGLFIYCFISTFSLISIKFNGGLFEGTRLIVKSKLCHGAFEGGLIKGSGLN